MQLKKRAAHSHVHMLCTQPRLLRKGNIREAAWTERNYLATTERIKIEL